LVLFFRPGYSSHGVVNNFGIGQSDFMWNIRSNRNIKRVYSQIWNTNQLLVSFDGCGVYRDWRYDSKWKTKAGWYHVDQNPISKPNRCCIQGFVSLTNQNETTGGLIVFPDTHLRFEQLNNIRRRPRDFIMIPSTHPILDRGQAIGKLIQCQAGDLVLWDSRLVHCNSPAFSIEQRDVNQPVELLRIVAYVSMSPTTFVHGQTIEEFRKKRKLLATNNATLTHWSTELVEASKLKINSLNSSKVFFPLDPKGDLPKMSLRKLDAYQRALLLGTDIDE
jgi:hypothetical protein